MATPLLHAWRTTALLFTIGWAAWAAAQPPVHAQAGPAGAARVAAVVEDYFATLPGYRSGDLIARSNAAEILRRLADAGWRPHNPRQILDDVLPDNHFVVNLLRTPQGQRFMRRVSGFDLIYDRLDRVAQVAGGPRMLEAIVRLPDGERYAHAKRQLPDGVPDFLELLPKNANGKVRTIRDYDRPTGRIYTADDLLARLRQEPRGGASAP